ncbi:MAG: histidine kinase, partial [Candidatus Accumulibacter sp.]|nr:histidine kinase [Accumulibacter sp.]
MPETGNANTAQTSPTYWKTLRYFGTYRLCVAALLAISSFFQMPLVGYDHIPHQSAPIGFYFLANVAALVTLCTYRRRFNRQLSIQVLLDVFVLTWLAYVSGGFRDSLGIMLLVTLAGASLVSQERLALFYASMATVAVLGEEFLRLLSDTGQIVDFFQAGLFCAGSFTVAISARALGRRTIANEELARQRGEALKNQIIVSQRVIEEMQDGVLVLDRDGRI